MDSFEINKIIAAILLTALIVIGIGKFADFLSHEKPKDLLMSDGWKLRGLNLSLLQKLKKK